MYMKHKLTKTFSYIRSFRHILLVLSLFSVQALFNGLSAQQVVVGNTTEPVEAAVLQLKTQETTNTSSSEVTDNSNITSTEGGLGLPRVKLVDNETLEPFIVGGGNATEKKEHTGLMVYNLYESPVGVVARLRFKKGVYIWDGSKWSQVGSGTGQRFFYMPAFNLPLDRITPSGQEEPPVSLYDVYRWQFSNDAGRTAINATQHPYMSGINPKYVPSTGNTTANVTIPSPENGLLYGPKDLDYVITHYDTDIIEVIEISDIGVLRYKVIDNDPGPESFINVVFVVR